MALNLAAFKTRTLTAAVFVVVMLSGLLWNHWSFFILFSIIHFGCWLEYQRIIGRLDAEYSEISKFHKYGVIVAGCCFMLFFTNDTLRLFGIPMHELGWWLGLLFAFILPIIELLFAGNIQAKNIGYSALGLLYISLSLGLIMDLRSMDYGSSLPDVDAGWLIPIVLIGSIWINDTMAYIVGSLIGKTPFSKISPKKTWEGIFGGAILAIVLVSVTMHYVSPETNVFFWTGIAAIAAIFGTIGDLIESKLKRLAQVKDSGGIMPGHGGFLDRFDSLLIATPVVWLYLMVSL